MADSCGIRNPQPERPHSGSLKPHLPLEMVERSTFALIAPGESPSFPPSCSSSFKTSPTKANGISDPHQLSPWTCRTGDIDFSVPVFLEHSWSFWLDRYVGPGKSVVEYEAALRQLGSFTTVQDFWRWFNNLPLVSDLQPGSSFHLMKTGIRPLWEDLGNVEGGTYSFRVSHRHTADAWLHLVLLTVGEQFDSVLGTEDDICGVSISVRRKQQDNVLSIWNKNAQRFESPSLQAKVSAALPAGEIKQPSYRVHKQESDFKLPVS